MDIEQFELEDVPSAPIQNPRIRNLITDALLTYKQEPLDLNWEGFPGGARIRNYRARFLQALMKLMKPKVTMELGSGSTTQIFSKFVGEKHVACEHLEKYYLRTTESLKSLGLDDKGFVMLLPLEEAMYDLTGLDIHNVELLLIDGPPLYPKVNGRPKFTRVNTLPYLMDRLTQDALVLFDSVERPWEQECLASWVEEFGVQYESPLKMKGLAIIDPWAGV